MSIVAGIAIVLSLFIVWSGICHFRLMHEARAVTLAWDNLRANLSRRAEIVCKMIDLIREHVPHERGFFDDLSYQQKLATELEHPNRLGEIESTISFSVRTLYAIISDLPDLRTGAIFSGLDSDLAASESHIRTAQDTYSTTTEIYNSDFDSFPTRYIARLFGFSAADEIHLELFNELRTDNSDGFEFEETARRRSA